MSNVRLFQKGESGNPKGTTSYLKHLRNEMLNKCGEIAINSLHIMKEIIYNPEEKGSVRVAAWNSIADRGLGKAIQTVIMDNDTEGKDAKLLTKTELDSYIGGDAIATFISMYQRGEPALLEAINGLTQPFAQDNKSDSANADEKIINDIPDINSNII